VCAGKNVKSYFAKLQFPPYSAPLWVWYIIGVLYYATFSFLIYRLLRLDSDFMLKQIALTLIFFMMAINALWNYIFFRARNLFRSFIVANLFPLMDVALFIVPDTLVQNYAPSV
jgi:tryptophan-rich sensory protein